MERLEFDLLFRWFVGLGIDDPVWDHSVFSKDRNRLLEGEIAAKFLAAVLAQPHVKQLLSSDHFSVDGTLVEACASMKSLKPRNGGGGSEPPAGVERNSEVDFRGEKRGNDTHVSTSDPDALLYRKGAGMEAKPCFIGHALMENRHGLLIGHPSDAGLRPCRAAGGSGYDRIPRRPASGDHVGRRQGLRRGGLRDGTARDQRHDTRFIAVRAWPDVRCSSGDGVPIAEFSWEGIDEGDQRSGRGWATPADKGGLLGHIFFHNGDDLGFACEPR